MKAILFVVAWICVLYGFQANGDLITTLNEHTSTVFSVAFSPDGSTVASGSKDSSIKLWSVPEGDLITSLDDHNDWVNSVAFSPDGTKLASGSNDKNVIIWSVPEGDVTTTIAGYGGFRSVAFSPDGTILAAASQLIQLFSLPGGDSITNLMGHTGTIFSVAFSPDGTKLASGSGDGSIIIWNVPEGDLITTISSGIVYSVAFSPDGTKLAAASSDNTLKSWNFPEGDLITTFIGHTAWVNSVAFSPDGTKLASGSSDKSIKIWNFRQGDLITTYTGHTGAVEAVAFSPDGLHIASGSDDQTVMLWSEDSELPSASVSVTPSSTPSISLSASSTPTRSSSLTASSTRSRSHGASHTRSMSSTASSSSSVTASTSALCNQAEVLECQRGTRHYIMPCEYEEMCDNIIEWTECHRCDCSGQSLDDVEFYVETEFYCNETDPSWSIIEFGKVCIPRLECVIEDTSDLSGYCYSSKDVKVDQCECHSTCLTCGYSSMPTGQMDCITCLDGSDAITVNADGTGYCESSNTTTDFDANSGNKLAFFSYFLASSWLANALFLTL